jgi:hypothetical protein
MELIILPEQIVKIYTGIYAKKIFYRTRLVLSYSVGSEYELRQKRNR